MRSFIHPLALGGSWLLLLPAIRLLGACPTALTTLQLPASLTTAQGTHRAAGRLLGAVGGLKTCVFFLLSVKGSMNTQTCRLQRQRHGAGLLGRLRYRFGLHFFKEKALRLLTLRLVLGHLCLPCLLFCFVRRGVAPVGFACLALGLRQLFLEGHLPFSIQFLLAKAQSGGLFAHVVSPPWRSMRWSLAAWWS